MTDLPFLTADLPGVGGLLKATPADFVVEEVPAYLPGGEGEHLFLWVEKENVPADGLVRHLAQTLGVPREEIGIAGLKDRRAITRQFVSVPARVEDRVGGVNTDSIRVLSATRHANKLKTGHLKGNRFSILLRPESEGRAAGVSLPVGSSVSDPEWQDSPDVPAGLRPPLALSEPARAGIITARLREFGVPNYYGEQRFGLGGETAALGFALLRGEKTAKDIPPAKRKFLLRLALSAAQSDLFNLALAERMNRRDAVGTEGGVAGAGPKGSPGSRGREEGASGGGGDGGEMSVSSSPPPSVSPSPAKHDPGPSAPATLLCGELRTVLAGDVMRKTATGGLFVAEDVPIEQARLDAGELQITGPLFGPKMTQPRGEPAEREASLLASADLPPDAFRRYPKLTTGTRRPYLIPVPDLAVTADPDGLRFTFTLPAGAYATVVMREVMK